VPGFGSIANTFTAYTKVLFGLIVTYAIFAIVKPIFKPGDKKTFERLVGDDDVATFESGNVHPVYATFALTRDAEWCSRLFVLQMKDDNEEGIGTFVHVNHLSPAFVGDRVLFEAEIDELYGNTLNCKFIARVDNRVIAEGRTGQKILGKDRIQKIFESVK
jgi:predicted thioesterase